MFLFSLLLLFSAIFDDGSGAVSSIFECPPGTNDCVKNDVKKKYSMFLEPNAEIGAEQIDPMFQKNIQADLGFLNYKLTDSTITGYRTCEVQEATYNQAKSTVNIHLLCQKFDLSGKYELAGKILTEHAEGNGEYRFKCGKYRLVLDLNIEIVARDGKKYKHIKDFNFNAEPLEPINFEMTNLFGADNKSGEMLLDFVNKNWKAVALAVQDPIFRPNLKKIIDNGNKYLKTIPIA